VTRLFSDGEFELTLGLRHFEDDVTQSENQRHTGVPTEPLYRANGTFDANSPRVVFTWHPAQNSTIYASYSEGFRSGFNQNANVPVGLFPPVKADTLKNYEIGTKGRFADGMVSIDAAVFFIDWQDVQQTLTVDFGGVPVAAPVNGESASGIGAEFGVMAQPIDGLMLGLNVSWNDLTADSALNSVANSIPLFAEGDRLNFSPEYTAGASVDYTFELGSGGYEGHFAAAGSYSSEQTYRNVLDSAVVTDVGDPMLIANTSFAVVSPHGWTATLFVDNVTNEQDPGVGLFHVPDWNQRARPRTAGVQFEYQF
jgi:outer membrane receptor protein involved in Fe transport